MSEYLVWSDGDREEDASRIDSLTAGCAAEEYVDNYECTTSEYQVASGREQMIVFVKSVKRPKVFKFSVEGESVPLYTATEIQEKS